MIQYNKFTLIIRDEGEIMACYGMDVVNYENVEKAILHHYDDYDCEDEDFVDMVKAIVEDIPNESDAYEDDDREFFFVKMQ